MEDTMGSVNFPTFFTKRVNRAIEQSSNRAMWRR